MIRNIFVMCSLLFGDMLYGEMGFKAKHSTSASETPSKELEQLFAEFKKYYLNAPWVIDSCMALPVEDCMQAFQEIVLLLATSDTRWYYFADLESKYTFDPKDCIWQCRLYDEWIKNARVDEVANTLYVLRPSEKSDDITFLNYCLIKNQSQASITLNIFYAFYTDCLTHVFEEYIENIRIFEHDAEIFAGYCSLAHRCLEKIESFAHLPWLKNSSWYLEYELAVKKLHEIMALVDDEYGLI